ncbi:MAG: ribonuclease HI [Deltaproteobacteria bacterium]|nr:ribonuclease HI [Deltaproteobacteria bacterium]
MKSREKLFKLLGKIKQQLETVSDLPEVAAAQLETDLQSIYNQLNSVKADPSVDPTIRIWSDGACSGNPGPGGWGTIIFEDGRYREFSGFQPKTTNNIMEMTGALEGIRRTPEGSHLIITTDSQYLVKGMTEWLRGWKRKNWKKADGKPVLNKSIWMALDAAAGLRDIQWQWVKGHNGHLQNERCDELARDAIEEAIKS